MKDSFLANYVYTTCVILSIIVKNDENKYEIHAVHSFHLFYMLSEVLTKIWIVNIIIYIRIVFI